jgi:hypothetical protein
MAATVDDGGGGGNQSPGGGGGRVLTPNLEKKLKLGVAMVEGGSGGDVHDAGAGQGMKKKKEDNSRKRREKACGWGVFHVRVCLLVESILCTRLCLNSHASVKPKQVQAKSNTTWSIVTVDGFCVCVFLGSWQMNQGNRYLRSSVYSLYPKLSVAFSFRAASLTRLAKYARALLWMDTKLYHSICIFYCPFFAIKCVKNLIYIYATFFYNCALLGCFGRTLWCYDDHIID